MKSNWKIVTIGDCCNIEKRNVIPEPGTTYQCFSLPAFDNNKMPEVLDGSDIKSSKLALSENTILFNKLNPKFRRVWNIHKIDNKGISICSSEFLPLKVVEGVDQNYLYYYVYSPYFTNLMDGIRTGTSNSQQRIDWKRFLQETIPLPPKKEQLKISGILKKIDNKIELNGKINKNLAA